jgi:hypothetical protein
MKHIFRLLLSLMVVLTMVLSAVTPVFAEDAPPPPAENPDGSGGKADKAQSNVTETAGAAAAVEESVSASAPAADTAAADFTSMPNYAPDGAATSGMGAFQGEKLVNTNGNLVASGTNLQAQAVSYAMPCPAGTLPYWYTGGTCNNTPYTVLQSAIDAALPGWTVWMQSYFGDGNDILINKPLTIQGSPFGSAYVGDYGGSYSIDIAASGVTIRDVVANGEVYQYTGYSGTLRLQDVYLYSPNYYGLWVPNCFNGSVILSQVYANANYYRSNIDVQSGSGTVTVVNSTFNNTYLDSGLEIYAKNTVKLENVEAQGNWGNGMSVEYAKGFSVKNGIFNYNYNGATPTTNPDDNWGYGLYAEDVGPTYGYSRAAVSLQNVNAAVNDEDGVYLENVGAVTIQNAGFSNNMLHGLYVDGYSTASLDGVTAKYNGWWGSDQGVDLWISGAAAVSNSSFESNWGTGLYVDTSGAITLKNVKAAFNSSDGAYLYGWTAPINVTAGYYDSNGGSGLVVRSHGSVTLNGIIATWNNDSYGNAAVDIDNCDYYSGVCHGTGNVTITNTLGQNFISNNWNTGLAVYTHGSVSINTLAANDNYNYGVDIYFAYGNVSLTNVAANNNGRNWLGSGTPNTNADGIAIENAGTITLDKVTTSYNMDHGIYLDNSYAATPKTITIKNVYILDNNNYGMEAYSDGAISFNHFNSIYNYRALTLGTWGAVTFSNTLGGNLITNNYYGAHIENGGTVSITGLDASDNYIYGMYLDASYGLGSVTISNSRFNTTVSGYGLDVYSKGNITLSNVQANFNFEYGAWLMNNYIAGKTVTVNKGSFSNNGGTGLGIDAGGSVTLNGIAASNNYYEGLYVRNDYFNTVAAYNVTISSSLGVNMFNNNGVSTNYDSVWIQTSGNVSISKATSNRSGDDGFQINITGAWSGKKVTFTCSVADYNWDSGFYVYNNSAYPVNVYLAGSGATGNYSDYYSSGNTVNWYFSRTNCP